MTAEPDLIEPHFAAGCMVTVELSPLWAVLDVADTVTRAPPDGPDH